MDFYSVKLPDKVDPELERKAKQIEIEILSKGNRDVENYGEFQDLKKEDEEKLFGTAAEDNPVQNTILNSQIKEEYKDEELDDIERMLQNSRNKL